MPTPPYPLTRKAISFYLAWVSADQRSRDVIKSQLSQAETQALIQLEQNTKEVFNSPSKSVAGIILKDIELNIKVQTLVSCIPNLSTTDRIYLNSRIENLLKIPDKGLKIEKKAEKEERETGLSKLTREDFSKLVCDVMKESGCSIEKRVTYENIQAMVRAFRARGYNITHRNVRALVQKARRYLDINVPRGGRTKIRAKI